MKTKKALITGIAGQDGSYLSEYLCESGYEVHGIIRRNSVTENQRSRLDEFSKNLNCVYGDITDLNSLSQIIRKIKPDEVYNLAAQSHVKISFEIPGYTAATNALGAQNVFDLCRQIVPEARVYQASSSEMFGNSCDEDMRQRETTPMYPVSPYGASKLFAYNIARVYRESYGQYISNGILFNHESPRRASNFVTSKVVKNAILITKGKLSKLTLGNLDAKRDWGHSKDYVRAMHAILQVDEPDEYVISTGHAYSVRDLCEAVFSRLNLDYRDYVEQDAQYMRPNELNYLCGDSSKARKNLDWIPVYNFDSLVDEVINHWMDVLKG